MQTNCSPSRFIKEIDQQYIDWPQIKRETNNVFNNVEEWEFPNKKAKTFLEKGTRKEPVNTFKPLANKYTHKPNPNFEPDNPEHIQIGMKVEHQRFGFGKVIHMEGVMPNKKATVFFQILGQEKQLLLKFAKLRIVNGKE